MTRTSKVGLVALVAAVLGIFISGCSNKTTPTEPKESNEPQVLLSVSNPEVRNVIEVQDRQTENLMQDPEVVGTATGINSAGKLAILVFLKSDKQLDAMPHTLDGIPVEPHVTGEFRAYATSSDMPHENRYSRPISLGVFGVSRSQSDHSGYCSGGGTLGCLVQWNGTQFILSNSHVFWPDNRSSASSPYMSLVGDPISQPGYLYPNCQTDPRNYVARLVRFTTVLPTSRANVDCAIAEVIPGQVRTDGFIVDIGRVSRNPIQPAIGMKVKKSGSRTGLTRSSIFGIHGTVDVKYEIEPNGPGYTRRYTNQVMIWGWKPLIPIPGRPMPQRFAARGDSGSLVVQDVTLNPRPVALFFAGTGLVLCGNPIQEVLDFLGVTMVGVGSVPTD